MNPLLRALLLGWMVLTMAASANAQRLEPEEAIWLDFPGFSIDSVVAVIGPSGAVDLPFLGSVSLAGLSLEEAELRLKRRFEERFAAPLGGFRLRRAFNPAAPIRYSGAVEHSGETFPTKGLRLSEILRRAEPTLNANLEAVEIRSWDGVRRVRGSLFPEPENDLELRPGDRVFVPELAGGNQVFVLGAVARPGAIDFRPGLTVREAVRLAGGPRPDGDASRVEVRRRQEFLGILDLALGDAPLERGDVVALRPRSDPDYVYLSGWVARPNRYPFAPAMSLLKAIEAAGGVLFGMERPEALVSRTVEGKPVQLRFDLLAIARREMPDPILQKGDRIEIRERRP